MFSSILYILNWYFKLFLSTAQKAIVPCNAILSKQITKSFNKMLLIKCSSTPHIGTHRLPFSDSRTRDLDTTNKKCNKHPPLLFDHHSKKLSFSQVSCSSSPVSNSASHFSESSGFRRAWSDGNLEGLSYSGSYCDIEDLDRKSVV